MEVDKPFAQQSSSWTTSLQFDPDRIVPLPKKTMSTTSPARTAAESSCPRHATTAHPARVQNSLVRSESAPLNIFDEIPNLSALSLDKRSMNFAAAAASHPRPCCPQHSASKPPPSRSFSSVELVGIVSTPRESSVDVVRRLDSKVSARNIPESKARSRQHFPLSREKSVFDMIQDDFPRTPAPILSSLPPAVSQEPFTRDIHPASSARRTRLASTASLDLDFDSLGTAADPRNELTVEAMRDNTLSSSPLGRTHRRSVSINWTGDFGGSLTDTMTREMPRSSSRSNLTSSSERPTYLCGKKADLPLSETSHTSTHSGSRSPVRSSSKASSQAAGPVAASSPQSSSSILHLASPAAQESNCVEPPPHQQSPLEAVPSDGSENFTSSAVDDLPVNSLHDYEYLVNQHDPSKRLSNRNLHIPEFVNHGYTTTIPGLFSGSNMTTFQPAENAGQYPHLFPAVGMFPSPFSNSTGGIGNGVDQLYSNSILENTSTAIPADNIKNMSFQMAAFINAQQHLYAAHMAHAAALAGNSSLPGLGTYSAISGRVGQAGTTIPAPRMRSAWESCDPTTLMHREPSGSRNNIEPYRRDQPHTNGSNRVIASETGHKGRSGRNRRGNRGHDDHGPIGSSRCDRFSTGSGSSGACDHVHSRSPLLEQFRATSFSVGRTLTSVCEVNCNGGYGSGSLNQVQNGREWQLCEIIDEVVEFATDQHGSRFIQQKLESASCEDKDAVLKRALVDAQRLMMDVFGNYVIQKLLDHGGETTIKLIAEELKGRMLPLSLHMYGCRVVQKALEVLEAKSRAALVRELDGHVVHCIRDQNGNHVIQKCVELVESGDMQFIVHSVKGQAVVLAGHSYGCRVVQRILEHGAPNQKEPIMKEIMMCIADLIKDQYGNYVIQHVVEHGSVTERGIVMKLVRGEVTELSQHKFASNVVERCLQFGSLEERQVLIDILIGGQGSAVVSPLNRLVRDQFGNYVVQRVLDVALSAQRDRVVTILRAQVPAIKRYSYGKHIIARLENHHVGPACFRNGSGFHSAGGSGHVSYHVGSAAVARGAGQALSAPSNDYTFFA